MAFLTAKTLPRRTVLRGIGTTLALPFLDAMFAPFSLLGQSAAKPVHRFQAFYVPNGMAMEYWTPTGEGTDFQFAPIQQALTPYRDQTLMLSGLKASWNYIHAGASGSFLTGTKRGGRNEVEIIADVSMDQLLAKHFGFAHLGTHNSDRFRRCLHDINRLNFQRCPPAIDLAHNSRHRN